MVGSLLFGDIHACIYRRFGSNDCSQHSTNYSETYSGAYYSSTYLNAFTCAYKGAFYTDAINTGTRYLDSNPGSIYACIDANS